MTFSAISEGVKCDWLDVTFSPVNAPFEEIRSVLDSCGCEVLGSTHDAVERWRVGRGVIVLEDRARFARASASGGSLDYLREQRQFYAYLSALADQPHAVTRLDACLDTESPGHAVVGDLWRRYPSECALTRKALPTKLFTSAGPDGKPTGTFYVGHRSAAKVTARVYDKRQQLIEVYGTDPGHNWTRYELTVRKAMGPTLRDAAQPTRVFWHFMAPRLLRAAQGVEPWEPGWGTGWEYRAPEATPFERLSRRVEASAELGRLIELSDALGPGGRDWLLTLVARRAGVRKAS